MTRRRIDKVPLPDKHRRAGAKKIPQPSPGGEAGGGCGLIILLLTWSGIAGLTYGMWRALA
jgi:hypothetical protein